MIKKIVKYSLRFLSFIVHFNPVLAIKLFVFPLFWWNQSYKRFAYKHKVIKKYLRKKFGKIICSFKERHNETDSAFTDDYPVWTLWWQGEEQMPPLVKVCFETLKKYSNGHKVNLVTKDNFQHFATLPDYILKKMEKGRISITPFSDILRVCLLYEHGGLWLDLTVLLTSPLPPLPLICSHLGFWTPKDDGNILEICFGARNWIVREDKLVAFCFYTSKHNILSDFIRTMFFSYLKKKSVFIDYFLIDYIISLAYDNLPEVRVMIDSVPRNNPKVHEIQHRLNLNCEYNKILFDETLSDTNFHKLSWKEKFEEYTASGKLTNYGFIMNNYP